MWLQDLKFVEARLDTVDVTLCVITRVKQEQFLVTRRGGAICPSVDSRVCIDYERGTYILNTPISLKVCFITLSSMSPNRMFNHYSFRKHVVSCFVYIR